jgi:hypothetical protein
LSIPISASQVAKITGINQWQRTSYFLLNDIGNKSFRKLSNFKEPRLIYLFGGTGI